MHSHAPCRDAQKETGTCPSHTESAAEQGPTPSAPLSLCALSPALASPLSALSFPYPKQPPHLALPAEIQEGTSLSIQAHNRGEFTILEVWYDYGSMVDYRAGQEISIIGLPVSGCGQSTGFDPWYK